MAGTQTILAGVRLVKAPGCLDGYRLVTAGLSNDDVVRCHLFKKLRSIGTFVDSFFHELSNAAASVLGHEQVRLLQEECGDWLDEQNYPVWVTAIVVDGSVDAAHGAITEIFGIPIEQRIDVHDYFPHDPTIVVAETEVRAGLEILDDLVVKPRGGRQVELRPYKKRMQRLLTELLAYE